MSGTYPVGGLGGGCTAPFATLAAGTWAAARPMAPKAGRLYPQQMPPIRVAHTLSPAVPPVRLDATTLSFDFGRNMAGFTSLARIATLARAACPCLDR